MTQLLTAFTVFVALHSIPATPGVRERLVARLGHALYIGLYSAVSLLALSWLFYAAFALDYIELWATAAWQGWVTLAAAPVGLFFVLAGLLSRNPFSTTARRGSSNPGAIVAITRHPVLWGFLIWSVGHIPPNGDLRSLVLFGGFAAFTAGSMMLIEKRSRKRFAAEWRQRTQATSFIPCAALVTGRARFGFDAAMTLALAVDAIAMIWLLSGGHAALFGADPLVFLTPR
ncbi:NnrU family protein [Pseudorhizobium marinum]|uniref:NnrU family protein n=1 Tax=Pseudorhizobium marinum TaxID=1496690 RepID=UPI000494E0A9|nr:NnrU family protein [Pseudorhizobium marinum]MBU1312864.1 NnrU family protein [Alphaproteobacteria bacterium]MBU1552764.1 NnrU family protein [Alphaproteobacteria bacterium]MBU2337571.1 NnrU family protein [Alphaproteobacteria bacterium]MBU2387288.1 NnrU family protein [Alphaproteobacteria bacterium]